jgi:hypothetical protein
MSSTPDDCIVTDPFTQYNLGPPFTQHPSQFGDGQDVHPIIPIEERLRQLEDQMLSLAAE